MPKRPRASFIPVQSWASLVNKRFIAQMTKKDFDTMYIYNTSNFSVKVSAGWRPWGGGGVGRGHLQFTKQGVGQSLILQTPKNT